MSAHSSSPGLDTVNVSFFPKDNGLGRKDCPIVITPRWDDSLSFLLQWTTTNRPWLNDMLLQHGAVLIRGFEIGSPKDMECAAQAFQPVLNNTYRGTSPRRVLGDTTYVFSAAEVPTNYPIAQHIEMSFLKAPPKQLFFGCLQPSQSAGGETALADFRKVFQDLSPELKQKFLDKGVRYMRTHQKKGSYLTYDVADMLGWPEMFGTDSKEEVEAMCAAEGLPVEWKGDTFVSTTQTHAFQLHPVTQEHVWFNHTQVFHWTTFPAELWFAFRRTGEWRLLLHCLLVTVFCLIKYALLGHKMALHSTFGDGEEISFAEMTEIRRSIHKNMVFFRWQKGDLLMIDNFSTSHGRQPTYDKNRKIAVAWACPMAKADAVTSLEPVQPISMENPQERTPESTLTKNDSAILQNELFAKQIEGKLSSIISNPQERVDHLNNLFTVKDTPPGCVF